MILLVTYDLKGRPEGYGKLFEALKKQGVWWHYLKSTWLVSTEKTPTELLEELKPHLNLTDKGGDLILITAIGGKRAGWLPSKAWDWIRKQEADKKAEDEKQDKQVS